MILWADDYWPFEHRQKIQVDNPIISSNFGLSFLTLLSHFRHFFLVRRSLMLQNWFWISLTGYEGHLCCQFVFWHFYLITKVNYAVNFIFGTFNPFWRSVMLPFSVFVLLGLVTFKFLPKSWILGNFLSIFVEVGKLPPRLKIHFDLPFFPFEVESCRIFWSIFLWNLESCRLFT